MPSIVIASPFVNPSPFVILSEAKDLRSAQ
jgi:hypothetical protein